MDTVVSAATALSGDLLRRLNEAARSNEGDMVTKWPWSEQSYLEEILATIRSLDSNHRLVDMNSGGPANKLGLGDVNDQHLYTDPRDVPITKGQYGERSTLAYVWRLALLIRWRTGMVGEYANVASFVPGHEWQPGRCAAMKVQNTSAEMVAYFIKMAAEIEAVVDHVSASVFTQTTDIEDECDGWMTFDRVDKFDDNQTEYARAALQAVVEAARRIKTDEDNEYFPVYHIRPPVGHGESSSLW